MNDEIQQVASNKAKVKRMSLTEIYIVWSPLLWKFKMLNNLLCRDGIERASDKHDNSQHKAILYHGLRLVLGLII